METPTDFGTIEDVQTGTREFIRRRWGRTFYGVGTLLAVIGMIFFSRFGLASFVPTLIWFTAGWAIAYKLVQFEFMRQFAERNNLTFEVAGDTATLHGDLFARGHSAAMTCVLSGMRNGFPLRFFLYDYTTGTGKQKRAHFFTVAEVTFRGNLPDVIVDTTEDRYTDDGIDGAHRVVVLGNRFDEHFTLRVAEGHEIEALEVFTPEIIEEVIGRGRGYSFEFINNHLYVWTAGHVQTSVRLRHMLELAHYLIDALAYRLGRLHDDVDAIKEAYR